MINEARQEVVAIETACSEFKKLTKNQRTMETPVVIVVIVLLFVCVDVRVCGVACRAICDYWKARGTTAKNQVVSYFH